MENKAAQAKLPELKSVKYIKADETPQPYFFQLRRVDPLTWKVEAVEVEDGKVIRRFDVKKSNTAQYVKAYFLEAALAQVSGKFDPEAK